MNRTVILFAVVLGGCTTASVDAPPTVTDQPPAEYRASIAQKVRETFFDPYSIRDAYISGPIYVTQIYDGTNLLPKQSWAVCVRANAKNRMGAYTGQRYTLFAFRDQQLTYSLDDTDAKGQMWHHCKDAELEPFPEIEAGAE